MDLPIPSATDVLNSTTPETMISLYTYPERVVVAVFFILISIFDVVGNSVVILAVVFSKKLRTSTNVFVVSLSVADFIAGLSLPMSVVALLSPGDTWPFDTEAPCFVGGLFLFISSGSSLLNLACIALNRAVLIKRPMTTYLWLYTNRNIAVMVATVWAVAIFGILIPPLAGVGGFGLDREHRTCSDLQNLPGGMTFDLIQTITFYVVPLMVILTCYVIIFVHVRHHFKTQKARSQENTADVDATAASSSEKAKDHTLDPTAAKAADARRHRISRQQLQITVNLFTAFCAFLVCVSPYCVTMVVTTNDRFRLFSAVLFLCNSWVNPIIYGAKHPQLKNVMRRLLRCQYSQIEEPSDTLKALMACKKQQSNG
ncbi:melatonin receptor type 1B-B-like [Patiria miniata]|uniref:G-protein coupled receptors family 1 profile domain-containing protein n=1 Tax=Patiria miniata TaxID=46514 RepID=A0A914BNX7_PATMI|nr:melatonin receptor type 1B-B-like [Patiria miniata]XP_038077660.1 melatonin receptor type 1B-B-like [Patiria miniata]